jgi:HSP20 family molecular chaperone IbpA
LDRRIPAVDRNNPKGVRKIPNAVRVDAVSAEIPGVRKEAIDVRIDGNAVANGAAVQQDTERAEGRSRAAPRAAIWRCQPVRSTTEKVGANRRNGVLALELPRTAAPPQKRVSIT